MKSMTGFSQDRFEFDNISLNISIKTLNHRFLDISIRGTGVTPVTDKIIRTLIKENIIRGKVEVTFDLFESDPKNWDIQFNEYLLDDILSRVIRFKKTYKENLNLSLETFLKIPSIFYLDQKYDEFNDEKKSKIKDSIETVLTNLLKSRDEEGEFILNDLSNSIDVIDENLSKISPLQKKIEEKIFNKYKERIKRFLSDSEIDERRLYQEAAIAADKACINEELQRLKSHSLRLKSLINNKEINAKGKEADFLAQEMQRETHTISSKTASMDIHDMVVKIRREIEKIKQQVQNVE